MGRRREVRRKRGPRFLFTTGSREYHVTHDRPLVQSEVVDRLVHFGEVVATLYHNLGIEANRSTVKDLANRPRYLVDDFKAMEELV